MIELVNDFIVCGRHTCENYVISAHFVDFLLFSSFLWVAQIPWQVNIFQSSMTGRCQNDIDCKNVNYGGPPALF